MRKFLILAGILVILIAVVAFAAFNLNSYLQHNRDWLAQQASQALGREVRFAEIGVSFSGGIGAAVSDLEIAEDATMGESSFLRVDQARILVNPWPALRGEYEISQLILDSPKVEIVRTTSGLNVESIGKSDGPKAPASDAPNAGDLPLLVSLFQINDGALRYRDLTAKPPSEITLSDFDLTVSDISLDRPIGIDASGRLLGSGGRDVRIDGTVGPVGNDPTAAPLGLQLRIGPLVIDQLKKNPLVGGSIPPELSSDGPVNATIAVGGIVAAPAIGLTVDATDAPLRFADSFRKPAGTKMKVLGQIEMKGDVLHLRDTSLQLADASAAVTGTVKTAPKPTLDLRLSTDRPLPLGGWEEMVPSLAGFALDGTAKPDLRITGSDAVKLSGIIALQNVTATKDAFRVAGLSPTIEVNGAEYSIPKTAFQLNDSPVELGLDFNADRETFRISTGISDLALPPILEQYAPKAAATLEGLLDADLTLNGTGTSWESLQRNLTGKGRAILKDGVLRDVNLVEGVLANLTGVQGLTNMLSGDLRKKHPGVLEAKNTAFDRLSGGVTIKDGRIHSDKLSIALQGNEIDGRGSVSFGQEVDFNGVLVASESLSKDLLSEAKVVQALVNSKGLIAIPFRVRGTLPKVRAEPDRDFIVRALGKTAIDAGLDKLFGKKPEPADSETEGATEKAAPKPEEQLLRKGLESLFGR